MVGWDHGGVGEQLHALYPQGAVAPFDLQALLAAVQDALARPGAVAVTMPAGLHAMQEATLSLYDELVRRH